MPRRKLTKPKDLDDLREIADDLPDITDQQTGFVQDILAGKSATEAYRSNYDTSGMLDRTVWAEASRLRANPSVTAWLSAARQACLGTAVITRESHLQQLERLREYAIDTGNVGAAVQAEHYRGKVEGLYVERIVDETQQHPANTMDMITKLFGEDIAKHIASQNARVIEHKPAETADHAPAEQ